MYKEERIVNNVLCVRYRPEAEFVPYTAEQLTYMLLECDKNIDKLERLLEERK